MGQRLFLALLNAHSNSMKQGLPHFTNEETEAQESYVTYPKSHSLKVIEQKNQDDAGPEGSRTWHVTSLSQQDGLGRLPLQYPGLAICRHSLGGGCGGGRAARGATEDQRTFWIMQTM